MKLSSITLITTALAAIPGTVAAPGPLHARAMERINSFERDVDNLFARLVEPPPQPHHKPNIRAAQASGHAAKLNLQAAQAADAASCKQSTEKAREGWKDMKILHTTLAEALTTEERSCRNAALSTEVPKGHDITNANLQLAKAREASIIAKDTKKKARKAKKHPE